MKARTVFDTLAYANRLKIAGMDPTIAETQAEANADMIANFLDNGLLTKQDLLGFESQLKTVESRLEARIDKLASHMNQGKSELEASIDQVEAKLSARIDQVEAKLSARIDQVEAKLSARIDQIEPKLNELRLDLEKQIVLSESRMIQHIKDVETRLTLRLGGMIVASVTIATTILHIFH